MSTISRFDKKIERRGTDATKYEELEEKYGRTDLLPLWIADMDFGTPAPVGEALRKCVSQPVLGYTTAPSEFWSSITGWLEHRHGWRLTRDDIDFVPGVKKGIGLCVNYFTAPGDRILIQPPVYHSFRSVVEGNGRVAVTNPLIFEDGNYRMDFDGLENAMREHSPRMMIVCNPHNPVGIQWDADTLRRVADICAAHGVTLLSDEIYADLVLDGHRHIPTATVSETARRITVTLGAPSKSFNIPGVASAWTTVAEPTLRDGFFAWLKASEFDTPPTCAIYGTISAYTECEDWLDEALGYISANCRHAADVIARDMPGVKAVIPGAGFGLWIDFRGTGMSHDELTDLLVNRARIAVSDGASFGAEGSGFVRLNTGVPREVLDEALGRIAAALESREARAHQL